ncbi:plasma membrane g-protein coupled receptor [Stagonosporopsis vannaccii]|nr:plasma membrane g-protein coupled receptor [Stagonosporopsis vannaccii]
MNQARIVRSHRTSLRHVPAVMNNAFPSYILVLLAVVPHTSSLTYNPVSMTDRNRAKEYGLGTAALTCALVSLLASTLCMYWFCRLQKRFRHRLVMILIYGDLMRGTWLFVFSIISLARGTVKTGTTFCQVSGFLVQYGTQTSDYAVFVMAIHSAIQVFYPSTVVSSDGLYPYRRYVYIGAFALPVLMAGLAFVNPQQAYVSQGAFCTLPIRPFWYRLALTWVPRYIIVLTIIGLAIAIYTHVGFEFRAYARVDTSFQSLKTYNGSINTPHDAQDEGKMEDITFELTNMQSRPRPERRKSSIGHDIFTAQRQSSPLLTLSPFSTHPPQRVSFESGTIPLELTRSCVDHNRPPLHSIPSGRSITDPISPLDQSLQCKPPGNTPAKHEPAGYPPSSESMHSPCPSSPVQFSLAKQRQRIHRQLRLMFIYPLVYTLMWLIPFAQHCMNYWDRYALQPIEFMRVGSSICICLMGFADALIFSLREKPWRGIEGSNGTFWGSFVFTRRKREVPPATGAESRRGSFARARARGSQSFRTSASGDYARAAAEQARVRLDLEREERMVALGERAKRKSLGSPWMRTPEKELFADLNVGDGTEGQVYDDNGLEDDTIESAYKVEKK